MAVYTRFGLEQLDQFLNQYEIGNIVHLEEIQQGVENSNYFLTTSRYHTKYVLTIYEKRIDIADLPYFLDFSEYLKKNGINAPSPIKNKQGHSFTDFLGKKAAIVSFLEGNNLDKPNRNQSRSAGEMIAKMHLAQNGFSGYRSNDLSPSGSLMKTYQKVKSQLKEQLENIFFLVEEEVTYMAKNFPKKLPIGNIHADIFPDNMFFDQDQAIGVIDFYFSCTDFLAYDLAIALCAWSFLDGLFQEAHYKAMLSGYHSIRPLSDHELEALPDLMRGAALRFLLTRSHDWIFTEKQANVLPKDPQEYYKILKFLQTEVDPLTLMIKKP